MRLVFNTFKTTNDVLQITGKYCTKEMFDVHMDYMVSIEILKYDASQGFFLNHDNDHLILHTASKIYSKLHHLPKCKSLESICCNKHAKNKMNIHEIHSDKDTIQTCAIMKNNLSDMASYDEYELVGKEASSEEYKNEQFLHQTQYTISKLWIIQLFVLVNLRSIIHWYTANIFLS